MNDIDDTCGPNEGYQIQIWSDDTQDWELSGHGDVDHPEVASTLFKRETKLSSRKWRLIKKGGN